MNDATRMRRLEERVSELERRLAASERRQAKTLEHLSFEIKRLAYPAPTEETNHG